MMVKYHRLVQSDAWKIMQYCDGKSGSKLSDEFYDEFRVAVSKTAENPERHHFDPSGMRRASLKRFPYHFLYRVRKDDVLILVLRHDKRHPSFGLGRK